MLREFCLRVVLCHMGSAVRRRGRASIRRSRRLLLDSRLGRLAALPIVMGILGCSAATALASPSMIRLGYPTCSGCHLSPQGRGLLTEYGKGIDEAESARGGVYEPASAERRRVMQDVRLLAQIDHGSVANGAAGSSSAQGGEWSPQARLWYRNATFLTARQRLSATVSIDLPSRTLSGPVTRPATD